jgi:hypothetical protein
MMDHSDGGMNTPAMLFMLNSSSERYTAGAASLMRFPRHQEQIMTKQWLAVIGTVLGVSTTLIHAADSNVRMGADGKSLKKK